MSSHYKSHHSSVIVQFYFYKPYSHIFPWSNHICRSSMSPYMNPRARSRRDGRDVVINFTQIFWPSFNCSMLNFGSGNQLHPDVLTKFQLLNAKLWKWKCFGRDEESDASEGEHVQATICRDFRSYNRDWPGMDMSFLGIYITWL